MNLKHLIYRCAHDYPGSIARLSDEMGRGAQVLTNKLNPNSETHHLTIAELETIGDFTESNIAIAEYFAHKANATVVALPTEAPSGDMSLLDCYLHTAEANGRLSTDFRQAWADGNIDAKEFAQLKQDTNALIGQQMAFLAEIERLVRS